MKEAGISAEVFAAIRHHHEYFDGSCYLAAVGRSERRRMTSTERLRHHEREIIAQKAIDLIKSDFAAAPNITVKMVMSIGVADRNPSVASFVHERMRPAVDESDGLLRDSSCDRPISAIYGGWQTEAQNINP